MSHSATVEFENRADLIAALNMTNRPIKGRQVRITLPGSQYGDRYGYGDRGE